MLFWPEPEYRVEDNDLLFHDATTIPGKSLRTIRQSADRLAHCPEGFLTMADAIYARTHPAIRLAGHNVQVQYN